MLQPRAHARDPDALNSRIIARLEFVNYMSTLRKRAVPNRLQGFKETMLIIAFRAGLIEPVEASAQRIHCEQDCVRRLEEVLGPSAAIVRTQLVIPPYRDTGRSPKVTHELAHREKAEPDVTFVGSLSRKEYARLSRDAMAADRQDAV
jgi:hypothetical protein